MTWFGTGNNVQLQADTSRRVCHLRLESARIVEARDEQWDRDSTLALDDLPKCYEPNP